MLFQETPTSTFYYMLLGFCAILGIIALFLISLVVRFRNLSRDLEQFEEIEANERT